MTSSSSTPNDPSELEPWADELARQTVRIDHATRGTIAGYDNEDLCQEVLLHWWAKRHTYRTDRGANRQTYFRRLAERRLTDLRRRARAAQRGGGHTALSLDLAVTDDGVPLADLLEDPAAASPTAYAEWQALTEALRAFLAELTEREQALLRLLAADRDFSRAARELGVSRSTVHRDLGRIRALARDDIRLRGFLA